MRNGLGDRAGTWIDPEPQIVERKTICLLNHLPTELPRSPEPLYLRWKGMEKAEEGDLYVRSGPGTVKLGHKDAENYVATRFGSS